MLTSQVALPSLNRVRVTLRKLRVQCTCSEWEDEIEPNRYPEPFFSGALPSLCYQPRLPVVTS